MGNIIQGKDLNIYYVINGFNRLAAHTNDCTITLNADIQETTTHNSGKGKTYDYTGKYGYTLSHKGLSNLIDGANFSHFQQAIIQSGKLNFIFTDVHNVQYTGTVLVTSVDFDSPVTAISSFTPNMTGDGELTIIYEEVPDPPLGSSVNIIDQFSNLIATVPAPGSYGVLRFDTISQGGAIPITPSLIIMQAS